MCAVGKTSVLSRDDWWSLLLQCLNALCEEKRFTEAELLVDSSLEFYLFYDDRVKRKELEYLGLSAAILDHNFQKAYNYIRSVCAYETKTQHPNLRQWSTPGAISLIHKGQIWLRVFSLAKQGLTSYNESIVLIQRPSAVQVNAHGSQEDLHFNWLIIKGKGYNTVSVPSQY